MRNFDFIEVLVLVESLDIKSRDEFLKIKYLTKLEENRERMRSPS